MEFLSVITSTLYFITIISSICLILLLFAIYLCKLSAENRKKRRIRSSPKEVVVGFFHPYCNAGGGGERVLWCAIRALQEKYPKVKCVIYTGDCDATSEEILTNARKTFNITLPREVKFFHLKKRKWVEAYCYPYFTLLGQSLGSMVLGYEAFNLLIPDVFLDTMGYAFTFFIFKYLGGCKIGCYVHYPTISTDMLDVVSDRTGSFNNRTVIANSTVLTSFKLMYYRIFAWLYGYAGSKADVVMVNSSWTKNHIEKLWGGSEKHPILKIFPPCDIKGFLDLPLEREPGEVNTILSIGQFRPEKNHALQVKSFGRFLSTLPEKLRHKYQLVLVGGCRNEGDKMRVEELGSLASQLGISKNVSIKVNIPFEELKNLLSTSQVGIHTMTNEHFGIGVVEFQAAGVVALAHRSGGPKMDIVIETKFEGRKKCKTGFLADGIEEYSDALRSIFLLSETERILISQAARKACERFSEHHFADDFLKAVEILME